jgi:glycerate-2-kinase
LGDPLATIASGPTFIDTPIDLTAVTETLKHFDPDRKYVPESVRRALARQQEQATRSRESQISLSINVVNVVLANNATAVDAAGTEAVRRGYAYYMESSPRSEGSAEALGRSLARQCLELANHPEIQCLISGGEPSVVLPETAVRGRGGRNQHLVLAALDELRHQGVQVEKLARMAILSGGTDGEDGPTDAAGAWLDASVYRKFLASGLDPGDYLRRCDAYNFFDRTASLLKTGPTHTNVCDIRVAIYDSRNSL